MNRRLFVAYLLDRKGVSVDDLLKNDFASAAIERELIAGQESMPSVQCIAFQLVALAISAAFP